MELGQQLKAHRKELGISQDELAEKIFVSRQSISNWENNKTYPDIHTLLLLAETFGVSLDELIKGDVEEMKEEINAQERAGFNRDTVCFAIFGIVTVLSIAPLYAFLDRRRGWLFLRTRRALQNDVRHPDLQGDPRFPAGRRSFHAQRCARRAQRGQTPRLKSSDGHRQRTHRRRLCLRRHVAAGHFWRILTT